MDISHVLRLMMDKGASDMFLTAGATPMMKVEGVIYPLGTARLTAEMTETIANHVMSEAQKIQFGRDLEMNFALAVEGTGRVGFNVFRQRGAIGLVIRAVRANIPSLDQMRLPEVLRSIISTPRGLILVVGSTGSGKSTTLAAVFDHRK
jgi:twitching motility protein PilU